MNHVGINPDDILVSSCGYTWPLPGKTRISSYFGYRNLNLYGASNYHSGIDIPAPERHLLLSSICWHCDLYTVSVVVVDILLYLKITELKLYIAMYLQII